MRKTLADFLVERLEDKQRSATPEQRKRYQELIATARLQQMSSIAANLTAKERDEQQQDVYRERWLKQRRDLSNKKLDYPLSNKKLDYRVNKMEA